MDPSISKAKDLLGKRFRVTVKGGRVLSGEFQCLDKQGAACLAPGQAVPGAEGWGAYRTPQREEPQRDALRVRRQSCPWKSERTHRA